MRGFGILVSLLFVLRSGANAALAGEDEKIRMVAGDGSIPKSINWVALGAVTPVKDRGSCKHGSWAFATADAVESINKLVTGELVELSAQQLLDCSGPFGANGCVYGFPSDAFFYLTDSLGLATAKDYPFVGVNKTCTKRNARLVSIDDFGSIRGGSDDTEILEQVAKQPVTALIDSAAADNYKGGIFKGPCLNDSAKVYLAVLIVGYGSKNGEDYWILKNSAGTKWGENGYMRLQRGNHGLPLGRCGINGFVDFPIKAKPPPSPPPPPSRPPPPPPRPCYARIGCGLLTPKFACCPPSGRPVCCWLWEKCGPVGCC